MQRIICIKRQDAVTAQGRPQALGLLAVSVTGFTVLPGQNRHRTQNQTTLNQRTKDTIAKEFPP